MSLRKIGFLILCLMLGFYSCNNDDDGVQAPEPLDLEEKKEQDNDSIVKYLKTHYYNSSAFTNNSNVNDLVLTEIAEGGDVPNGNTLLFGNVASKTYTLGDITYPYYFLKINQGQGINSPNFSDNTLIAYEGYRVSNDVVFDTRLNPNPAALDISNTIFGWRLIIPEFNTSVTSIDNGDGTVTYNNSGVGMMFIPSGLAYLFSNNPLQFEPLIFKFELLKSFENDHDEDGIPSYLEDIVDDKQFVVFAEETELDDDTDGDGTPNYFDNDDDDDGVLTKDEIVITTENRATIEDIRMLALEANQKLKNHITKEEDGTFTGTIITFTDTDNDGTPDYLDAE